MIMCACAFVIACNGHIETQGTVTKIGALGEVATGGSSEGMVITFDECPDESASIAFDKTLGAPALPPATVACLRALAVGSKVDMKLATHRNMQTSSYDIRQIATCALPNDYGSSGTVSGPRVCKWSH